MDVLRYQDEMEAVIPGVFGVYKRLRTKNGMGFYTSNGAFYNHTFFGRDNAMAAKFVADFDHQATRETIIALASLQGVQYNTRTQEAPGRIHHEFRDFQTWEGGALETFALRFFGSVWGSDRKRLLTYFSADSTALYIRLIHKYVTHVDRSFLDVVVKNQHGDTFTIRESVTRAAEWICEQIDDKGHFVAARPNNRSLPYQTFADSATAFPRADGSLANYQQGIAYTEIQAFAVDALEDATHMIEGHSQRHKWQKAAHAMRDALLADFWDDETQFFGSAYDKNGLVAMPTVSAGWTLNTALWDEVPKKQRQQMISSIVRRLFSDDFLTPVGLRSRSLHSDQPLSGVVEYHGRLTVWPMFTFMVIEGLRRHRLHKLAEELENRLINGINASGDFEEFLVVDGGGHLLRNVPGVEAEVRVDAQMLPEKNIAFTVIPAIVLAYRAINRKRAWPSQEDWQKKLEEEILNDMERTEQYDPRKAHEAVAAVVPTKFCRFRGSVRTTAYFLNESRKM